MLKSFRIFLVFSSLLFLGLFSLGFAQNDKIQASSSTTPLLTKQQVMDGFNEGINTGATHMLVVIDTWNFEDSHDFIVYSYPGEDVNNLIKDYTAPGYYRVRANLDMKLDLNQQLKDTQLFPEYP